MPTGVVQGINTVVTAATGAFTIDTIATILGIALVAAASLFLLWWGSRKVVRMIKGAFTKGKLSL